MAPERAALDAALARVEETVILRRVVGVAPNTINVDIVLPATVRSYRAEELVGGISQTDNQVIISPTLIADRQWPGGELPSATVVDPSLPRRNDKVIVDGRIRNVEFVNPITVKGELVRIEMRVSG